MLLQLECENCVVHQKISLKYFREQLKIRKIPEMKLPAKIKHYMIYLYSTYFKYLYG